MKTLQPSEVRSNGVCWIVGSCGRTCAKTASAFPFEDPTRRVRVCPRFLRMHRVWDGFGTAPLVVDCADNAEEAVALALMDEGAR